MGQGLSEKREAITQDGGKEWPAKGLARAKVCGVRKARPRARPTRWVEEEGRGQIMWGFVDPGDHSFLS